MNQQCGSCGGFNNIQHCTKSCRMLICDHCRVNHESVCEYNGRLRGAGLGATVRSVPEAKPQDQEKATKPELPTTEQVEAIQKAIKELEDSGESFGELFGNAACPTCGEVVPHICEGVPTLVDDHVTYNQPEDNPAGVGGDGASAPEQQEERPTTMPAVLGAPYLLENAKPEFLTPEGLAAAKKQLLGAPISPEAVATAGAVIGSDIIPDEIEVIQHGQGDDNATGATDGQSGSDFSETEGSGNPSPEPSR